MCHYSSLQCFSGVSRPRQDGISRRATMHVWFTSPRAVLCCVVLCCGFNVIFFRWGGRLRLFFLCSTNISEIMMKQFFFFSLNMFGIVTHGYNFHVFCCNFLESLHTMYFPFFFFLQREKKCPTSNHSFVRIFMIFYRNLSL